MFLWTLGASAVLVWWWLARSGHATLATIALLMSVAALGASWHHSRWYDFPRDDLGRFANGEPRPAVVELVALESPRRLPAPPEHPMRAIPVVDRTMLDVEAVAIRDGQTWRPAAGRATLMVDGHLLAVHAGDRLRVAAQLAAPTPAMNPGEFDFAEYARGQRERAILRASFPDCVRVQSVGSGWSPARWIADLRQGSYNVLEQSLSPGRVGLASAILLGERAHVDDQLQDAFLETGTIHLMAISGLHVGILAATLFFLLRLGLLPRDWALLSVCAATVLYALLVGGRPPVVRATILVVVLCLGMSLGRRGLGFNSLAAAALVVLALNPADLFRVGSQLSFLAVGVLIWFHGAWPRRASTDPLDRLIARSRPWPVKALRTFGSGTGRFALASLAIWLIAAPLVASRFHLVSPVAVPMNLLLWIPMTVALVSGFAVLALGWLLPPVADLFGCLCDHSLGLLQYAVEGASQTSGSHLWVPGPDNWWLVVLYLAIVVAVLAPRVRIPSRWAMALCCVWIVAGVGGATWKADRGGRLDCTFLSVGHGCSVLLELPGGRRVLYDAGRLGSPETGGRQIAAVLWERGIRRLDAVVLSHADVDHYNALPELLGKFAIDVVYVSPLMRDDRSPAVRALFERIDAAGIPVRAVWRGDRLRTGDASVIEVVHPPEHGVLGSSRAGEIFSDNANSIVLAVEHDGRRILLTGDLESPGLDDVIAEARYDCDVLLAPHHGSARSDPPGFAAWCTPEWVIVSGGHGEGARTASEAYISQGARVLQTAVGGAIHVSIAGGQVDVRPFRGEGN